jgi:hypothetical protein
VVRYSTGLLLGDDEEALAAEGHTDGWCSKDVIYTRVHHVAVFKEEEGCYSAGCRDWGVSVGEAAGPEEALAEYVDDVLPHTIKTHVALRDVWPDEAGPSRREERDCVDEVKVWVQFTCVPISSGA